MLRHIGESEERCTVLCGADLDYDVASRTNTDLFNVTWDEDGSWLDDVTCPECLRLAMKIGGDAGNRMSGLAVASVTTPPRDADHDDMEPLWQAVQWCAWLSTLGDNLAVVGALCASFELGDRLLHTGWVPGCGRPAT